MISVLCSPFFTPSKVKYAKCARQELVKKFEELSFLRTLTKKINMEFICSEVQN